MRRITTACCGWIALVALLPALAMAQPKPPKVRVYIWTAQPPAGGIVDPDQQDRDDSVKDMIRGFGMNAGKETEVVAAAEQSQVQIEVLSRGPRNVGGLGPKSMDPLQGGARSAQQVLIVNATLRFGDYATDLECRSGPSYASWKASASDCAMQTKKWIKANQAQFAAKP